MKASVHRMEIDRIRFVLSSYLRSRLQKVSGSRNLALKTNFSFSDGCHIWTPVCPDWKVFPTRVGEREVPAGGRAVAAFTGGVCLRQRVSTAECSRSCRLENTAVTSRPTCRYLSNTEAYLKAVALKRMPPNLQTVDMLKAGENSLSPPCYAGIAATGPPDHNDCVFWRNPSAWALSGLLCVPAGEGEAGEHPGGAWDGRSEVKFIPSKLASTPTRWQCRHSPLTLSCLSAEVENWLMLICYLLCVREYVVDLEEGSQHLMRYRTIAPLVSSGAVNLIWTRR